jgi:hypothetical protein
MNAWADVPTAAQECAARNEAVCEVNSVTFRVAGDCPADARTIQTQGHENCSAVQPREAASLAAPRQQNVPDSVSEPVSIDMPVPYHILIPVLSLLALAVVVSALKVFRRLMGSWSELFRVLVLAAFSGLSGAVAGWRAGIYVYHAVYAHFGNHDTTGPWLIAAPVGAVVGLAVAGITVALVAGVVMVVMRRVRASATRR